VSIVDEKGKSDACGKATKGAAKGKASMPCKGKSAGKEVEEGRKGGDGACGQATRSVARMKEEFNRRVKEESRGAL